MQKKLICAILATVMTITPTINVFADRESDLREEQAWTANQLNATYAQIDNLYYQKQQLQSEIDSLDANLVNLMVSIQSLEQDIAEKNETIKNTVKQIKKAQKAKEKQYNAMKKRIQFLYEKGGNNAWFQMMLASNNMSDLLTRAEYSQKMYEYDRKELEKYGKLKKEVQKLKDKYENEKAELESMKAEQEAESANLQTAIDERRAMSANCDNEIAYAQQLAADYTAIIQQQQAEIERLEAERIAAEEAARAEAERLAAEQAVAGQEAIENGENEESNEESYSDDYSEENTDYEYDEYGNVIDSENTVDVSEYEGYYDSSINTSSDHSYSGSGSSVVDYATQFVGNPYVWGGTSLTNGADCSGFVQSVYSNFGVSLPRTSYEQQNAGREVSYSEAQPGDLICYGGHVAIYMGDGKIVHASNSRDGIKVSNDAAYRTILSVRRLV